MAKNQFTSLLCPSEMVTEEQLVTDMHLMKLGRSVETLNRALNRRRFLGGLAAAGAVAAVAGSFPSRAGAQAAAPSIVDVLNFALNLEYLEANFYLYVSSGTGVSTADQGASPGAILNAPGMLALDAQTLATAKALAQDEVNHIHDLQSAISTLGGTAISQPSIDFSAGGKMSIKTQAQFLAAARQFTAVGNSAYAGSAQFLVSNTTVLATAGQILGAEGQHLGAVNYLCALQGVVSPAVDAMDYPPVPPNTFFTVTPTSDTAGPAFGPVRTVSEVLGIVYGVSTAATTMPATGVTKGGFFPNGVNGTLAST